MEHADYTASITVNADANTAQQAISKVAEWWTAGYTGHAEKVNDVFTVTFGETFVNFKVTEVVPGKKIVWKVTDCYLHWQADKKEWNNTEIVWEIVPDGNSTTISMTHVGLVPEVECFENCREGWDFYIRESLFKLLTEGKGVPDLKNKVRAQAK